MKYLYLLLMGAFLIGCSNAPSNQAIQTAIAQTQVAQASSTPLITYTPSFTNTLTPTATIVSTSTPTITPTKKPTSIPRPTNTPTMGEFNSPAPIGMTIQKDTGNNFQEGEGVAMAATVLDVKRGKEAESMAKNDLAYYFAYEEPIEGQEYLAVQIKYDVIKYNETKPFSLNACWQVSLRYEDNGNDQLTVNPLGLGQNSEAYAPFSETYWVYFLVREEIELLLYFQPLLYVMINVGGETISGAYFSVNSQ